jgi:hypothetical protein
MLEPVEKRLLAFWRESGAVPRPGVSAADLRACEDRIGRSLPDDVAKFYRCVNGTEETTDWLFEAWSLEKLGSVPEVVTCFAGIPDYSRIATRLPEAADYFAFADYMIWSRVFAVRLAPGSTPTQVVGLCGDSYVYIAPTFDEFWERYLIDPDAALFAK